MIVVPAIQKLRRDPASVLIIARGEALRGGAFDGRVHLARESDRTYAEVHQ